MEEGVAAVVKCPRSSIAETKDSLIFEDSIPANVHNRLPPLPFMEYEDWDGNVRMSPMRLTWENPNKPMMVSPTRDVGLDRYKLAQFYTHIIKNEYQKELRVFQRVNKGYVSNIKYKV